MSRRDEIQMTAEELAAFLEEERVVTCATIGPNGRPHLMPLWYCLVDGHVAGWTYGSSQKIQNLRRDPRATLQVEAGDSYDQLRGVMMECDVALLSGPDEVLPIGLELAVRYAPGNLSAADAPDQLRGFVAAQAGKRVAMIFTPTRTVSWDHRKLGGTY